RPQALAPRKRNPGGRAARAPDAGAPRPRSSLRSRLRARPVRRRLHRDPAGSDRHRGQRFPELLRPRGHGRCFRPIRHRPGWRHSEEEPPLKIGILMTPHSTKRNSPLMAEVLALLQQWNVKVDVVYPDDRVTALASLR